MLPLTPGSPRPSAVHFYFTESRWSENKYPPCSAQHSSPQNSLIAPQSAFCRHVNQCVTDPQRHSSHAPSFTAHICSTFRSPLGFFFQRLFNWQGCSSIPKTLTVRLQCAANSVLCVVDTERGGAVQSCLTLCDPRLLCMGFPRQEYWCGLPFPSPMRESEVMSYS